MSLTVQERGETLATFRYIHVEMMETLARWVPTTPEMEVKLLFGAHIWDVAQHADALGKRVYELRMPLQHSLAPVDEYVQVLKTLSEAGETPQKIAGIYEVMLPSLVRRYTEYLERTDSLMDAPSVRVVERILQDQSRMDGDYKTLCDELPDLGTADPLWLGNLRETESAIGDFVVHRSAAKSSQSSE